MKKKIFLNKIFPTKNNLNKMNKTLILKRKILYPICFLILTKNKMIIKIYQIILTIKKFKHLFSIRIFKKISKNHPNHFSKKIKKILKKIIRIILKKIIRINLKKIIKEHPFSKIIRLVPKKIIKIIYKMIIKILLKLIIKLHHFFHKFQIIPQTKIKRKMFFLIVKIEIKMM